MVTDDLPMATVVASGGSLLSKSTVSTACTTTTTSILEAVAEQVVEEGQAAGQLVLGQDQQVVMVTQGDLGAGQQLIITEDGLQQVIQIGTQGEQFVMRNFKSEPEDLSVVGTVREEGQGPLRTINLEAGAQAIQASAAAAVQNVIRSLKEEDKRMLQQILPNHMLAMQPTPRNQEQIVIVEGSGGGGVVQEDEDLDITPTKRTRSSASDSVRVQIAKQYTPYGFHCVLEAATDQWVRKDEDRCTYLNKGQFYGVSLEYRANPAEPFQGDMTSVKSVIMLVFRDAKNPEDELNAWDFWHQRQPTNKQRIIDAETNNMGEQCGIQHIEDVSYNAIALYWNPLEKPAFVSCAIQCLSTDFSLQKGVKGLPMHLQVDTYTKNPGDGEYDLIHRAYCQVKVFCDKGAERKFRQEERRAARKVAVGGQRVLEMYHQCQDRSEFYSMVDLSKNPVLYTPQSGDVRAASQTAILGLNPTVATPGASLLRSNAVTVDQEGV